MKRYQLPNVFKRIGIVFFALCLIALFVNKFSINVSEFSRLAKYGLLVGLLIISISKDKIEDELIKDLRMRSFTFAFIIGVVFAIGQPFIDYLVDYLFTAQEATLEANSDFEILWMLLSVQVFYFEYLKRMHQ